MGAAAATGVPLIAGAGVAIGAITAAASGGKISKSVTTLGSDDTEGLVGSGVDLIRSRASQTLEISYL